MYRLSGLACPYFFRAARPVSLAAALLVSTSLSNISSVHAENFPQIEIHLEALDNLRRSDASIAVEESPFQNQLDDFYGKDAARAAQNKISSSPIKEAPKSFSLGKPAPVKIEEEPVVQKAPAAKELPQQLSVEQSEPMQAKRLPMVVVEETPVSNVDSNNVDTENTIAATPENSAEQKPADAPAGRRTVWSMMRDLAHFKLPPFGKKREADESAQSSDQADIAKTENNFAEQKSEEIPAEKIVSNQIEAPTKTKESSKESELPPALPEAKSKIISKEKLTTAKEPAPSRYTHAKKSPEKSVEKSAPKVAQNSSTVAPSLFKDSANDEDFTIVSPHEANTKKLADSSPAIPEKLPQRAPSPVAIEPLIKPTRQKAESAKSEEEFEPTKKTSQEPKKIAAVSAEKKPKNTVVAALEPKTQQAESRFTPILKKPAADVADEKPVLKQENSVAESKTIAAPAEATKPKTVAPISPITPSPASIKPITPIKEPAAAAPIVPIKPQTPEVKKEVAPQNLKQEPVKIQTPDVNLKTPAAQKTPNVPTATPPVTVATLAPPVAQKLPDSFPNTPANLSDSAAEEIQPKKISPTQISDPKEQNIASAKSTVATNVISAAPPPEVSLNVNQAAKKNAVENSANPISPAEKIAQPEQNLEVASLPKAVTKPILQAAPAISPDTVLFQLKYSETQTSPSDSERDAMLVAITPYLSDRTKRVRVVSYASPDDAQGNKARRLSLQRAIQVRSLLMNAGFESLRVHVQAMGDKVSGSGPADRVDLFVISE